MTATLARPVGITYAQGKVLRELMRDGASKAEIGLRLHLSEDTVKSHVKELLRRCGSANRTALAIDLFRDRITVYLEQP